MKDKIKPSDTVLAIIGAAGGGGGGKSSSEEEPDADMEGKLSAARDLRAALKSDDDKAIVGAFEALVALCHGYEDEAEEPPSSGKLKL